MSGIAQSPGGLGKRAEHMIGQVSSARRLGPETWRRRQIE